MTALFRPKATLIGRLTLLVPGILFLFGIGWWWLAPRTDWVRQVRFHFDQPVPFSHQHHVAGLGIDCRFCHTSVEVSARAGLPPTWTCMTCHSQIWTNAELLAPVRKSLAENADRLGPGEQPAGLCVFQPLHSYREGRWLPVLSRRGGPCR